MSSALVRQALEFVDQEELVGKRSKRRAGGSRRGSQGQETRHPYKRKNKKPVKEPSTSSEQSVDEKIKKLLALSTPVADTKIADKIVERAIKGKPLLEKIEVKPEEQKSILFPDEEPFSAFEKQPFCS